MSGLIVLALLCSLPGVVEPGVGEGVRQTAFALPDVEDEAAEVGAAPTTGGRGARSAKGHLLAAVALECDCDWNATGRPCRRASRGSRSGLARVL